MARHNLSTVIGFEFTRTIKKRSFWAVTLLASRMEPPKRG